MVPSIWLFAGGHSSCTLLLLAKLLNTTFSPISFNWPSTTSQLYEGSNNPHLLFYPMHCGTDHSCPHENPFHHHKTTLLALQVPCWSHKVYHSACKPCTLHSPTYSSWTPPGVQMDSWSPNGVHLEYNQICIFLDHPAGVHVESA